MTNTPNETYEEQIKSLLDHIEEADAIVVGAASGLSAAAGFRHYYERDEDFIKNFSDFEDKYGYHCTFDGAYYPYMKDEQRWAFTARFLSMILNAPTGDTYFDLYKLIKDKPFHVITTNQDAQFSRLFDEENISTIQGDFRYFQCSHCCQDKLYDAKNYVDVLEDKIDENLEIPTEYIPRCPNCGAKLDVWARSPVFLEGSKYIGEHEKAQKFLQENKDKKILFLELGVGRMTPMFIQEPFWNLTYNLPNAYYITVNPKDALMPVAIKDKGLAIPEDISKILKDALEMKNLKKIEEENE